MADENIFDELKRSWGSPIVARDQISRFSGGLLHPRTMSNLDSRGLGPKGRFRVGKKIAYPVDSVIEWLKERSEFIE